MNHQDKQSSSSHQSTEEAVEPHARRSIITQLLLSVNSICAVFLLLFVAYDYQQETKHRLGDKQLALTEEAIILHSAVREIQHHGPDALQQLIDNSCSQMLESHSPGHHIIVRFGDHVIQAQAHHRSGDELLNAVESAVEQSRHRGQFKQRELIVGTSGSGNLTVYVSEFTDELKAEVSEDTLRRLGGSVALGFIAAIIVNIVVWRVVVKPIERLVGLVESITDGEFGEQVNGFRSRELSYLSRAINRMSGSLERSERHRNSQLEKARRIQQNLLPETPDIPDVNVSVYYEPAEEVAGDFYDTRQLDDGSWVVLMADVTGHGVPAAMSATLLKAHFAEGCERFSNALDIMGQINERFSKLTLPGDFATAILLRILPDKGLLQIVNAGHDAALCLSPNGQLRSFDSSGLLLGVDGKAQWTLEEASVLPGDRVLIYTDGVPETFDEQGEMFGKARVIDSYQKSSQVPCHDSLAALIQEVGNFRGDRPQLDDVTAILIEFK